MQIRQSYHQIWISYTGKMPSLYWIGAHAQLVMVLSGTEGTAYLMDY